MAPLCFALGRNETAAALVSLERCRFRACPHDRFISFFVRSNQYGHGRTGRSGSYGPDVATCMELGEND